MASLLSARTHTIRTEDDGLGQQVILLAGGWPEIRFSCTTAGCLATVDGDEISGPLPEICRDLSWLLREVG